MSSTISALCMDLNSDAFQKSSNNNSTTFSSSMQVPSIDVFESSTYSNDRNPRICNHSSNSSASNDDSEETETEDNEETEVEDNDDSAVTSYTKSSKIDLSIKLKDKDSASTTNKQNTDNIQQSVTPLTPNTKTRQFALNEAGNIEQEDDEQLSKTDSKLTAENTPTPTMKRTTPSAQSKEFPATEPVMDPIVEHEDERDRKAEDSVSLEIQTLTKNGFTKFKVITNTLQGNIFVAKKNNSEQEVVIKKTLKKLHNEHVTVQNGRKFGIYENILKECVILKHLTDNKNGLIMTSFTKFDTFFDDTQHYYLSMEHGGSDLFDFIIAAHEKITKKELKIKEWRKFTKYLFWQMVVVLKWLHNDMNICHLDISLENILCKNATFVPLNASKTSYTINPNVQIKICDFGLAEIFKAEKDRKNAFLCTKYCGKTNYKAPQVYEKKKVFDARKADIWSLGVVLFCMLVGSPPYNKPIGSDQAYQYIKKGIIDQLLFQWERNHFITVKVLSLLHSMLQFKESERFLVEDVIEHPWLSLYYTKYRTQMDKKSRLQREKNKGSSPRLPYYNLSKSKVSNISQ